MQIVDALKQVQQKLSSSESSRLDAEILLCAVLNCERTYLYTYPQQELSCDEIKSFNKLANARSEGQPVAYLINQKEFWSLSFHITQDTLIPRPETELLVETTLNLIPKDSGINILDLGTGSGVIAIAIAIERPSINITATDLCDKALKIAKQNADLHKTNNIQFKKANWFKIENTVSYDLIVSNPPYISNNDPHLKQGDVQFEPRSALTSGKDGLDNLRLIIEEAKNNLSKRGWLLVEHGYNQEKRVQTLFNENNFISVSTLKDYGNNDRVTFGQLQ